ncbi:MAG: DUF6152 family protein [Gammaproteobacteria bacterium]
MKRPIARKMRGALLALMVAAPVWASAHHSTALFDHSRTLTLEGVVKEFRWINPHAIIQVVVKGGDGREEEWSVQMSTPRYLAHAGWTASTLKAGDAVTLLVEPLRDGTKVGAYVSGAGPPGAFVAEPPTPPPSTRAPAAPR